MKINWLNIKWEYFFWWKYKIIIFTLSANPFKLEFWIFKHNSRPIERPFEPIVPTSFALTVTLVVPAKTEADDEGEELDDGDDLVKPTERPIIIPIADKQTITEIITLRPNKLNLQVNIQLIYMNSIFEIKLSYFPTPLFDIDLSW